MKQQSNALSETAEYIKKNKSEILLRWEAEARARIDEARELSHPILIDTLPTLLDHLSESLSPTHPRQAGALNSTVALEHGGERARLTDFNLTALINELRILRKVLTNAVREKVPESNEECIDLIHVFVDEAIQSSAQAFALVQAELREHVIATLTHDMRSPLTAANLAADLILRKSEDEKIQAQALKIKHNHRRLDGLIQNLLNTTLLRAGGKLILEIEVCQTEEIINQAREILSPTQVERLKTMGEDIPAYWDRSHILRALENLLTNAFKYGDSDSNVTLTTGLEHGRVFFKIHNFGPHIPKEEQETIFQIFRRAESARDGKRPGWGLGLPLVRAVAEAHGGSLAVESIAEHGTTFIIDIPQDARPFLNAAAHGLEN